MATQNSFYVLESLADLQGISGGFYDDLAPAPGAPQDT